MKTNTIILSLMVFFCSSLAAVAQSEVVPQMSLTPASQTLPLDEAVDDDLPLERAKYGFCSSSQLLEGMPEYVQALSNLKNLRAQYLKEAEYNEVDFRRQFQEYLQGQKDFPQAILLKRQRDLQESMEKGIAFRTQMDSLLQRAETDMLAPLRERVNTAIQTVGRERGYDFVFDTDLKVFPYLNATLSEDITTYVEEKLK